MLMFDFVKGIIRTSWMRRKDLAFISLLRFLCCVEFSQEKLRSSSNNDKDASRLLIARARAKRISVGIVDVPESSAGRHVFIDNFFQMIRSVGYRATVVDIRSVPVSELNSFDILHFSDTLQVAMYFWKIVLARHPVKVLTIHGWVVEEAIFVLKEGRNLRKIVDKLLCMMTWGPFVKPIAENFLFDAVTCPSRITARKNKLKRAIVIKNAVFPEKLERTKAVDTRVDPCEILFVTYVSIGGVKISFLPRLIRVINRVNERIHQRKAILEVFGKLPKRYAEEVSNPYVRIMGFSDEFLGILKGSDLFWQGAPLSELGYAAVEAGILGIPIAKFTDSENSKYEEVRDGWNAILASTEQDMTDKLLVYISDLCRHKERMGKALREYFLKTRSWFVIAKQWSALFEVMLTTRKD